MNNNNKLNRLKDAIIKILLKSFYKSLLQLFRKENTFSITLVIAYLVAIILLLLTAIFSGLIINANVTNSLVKGSIITQPVIAQEPPIDKKLPPPANQLVLEIQVEKDPIKVGEEQTIIITAKDKNSSKNIDDAIIDGTVTYYNRDTETFYDDDGQVIYHWIIESNTDPGPFRVTADASAEGYELGHGSKIFNVINGNGKPPDGDKNGVINGNGRPPDGPFPPKDWIWIIIICIISGGIGAYVAKHRHPTKPPSVEPEKSPSPHVEVMTQGGIEEY